MKDEILIVGAFGFDTMDTGGQPVKTRELYYGLQEAIGEEKVHSLETIGWKKHPIKLFLDFFRKARKAKAIIMLPAHNGVAVFSRLLVFAKKLFHCRIYYDVIGGWLPEKLAESKRLGSWLFCFNGIWVETTTMKENLLKSGLTNLFVIRNFKTLTPVSMNEIGKNERDTLKLCTFSRVVREKGIEDAVRAVISTRQEFPVSLDIYGPIDNGYAMEFEELQKTFPEYIHYQGVASPANSVNVLKEYDALLFPTRYATEGIPGTIVDAYAAGVPVISSRWNSYGDVVEENVTGVGYEIGDIQGLRDCIRRFCTNREELKRMSKACRKKYDSYSKGVVISQIVDIIGL